MKTHRIITIVLIGAGILSAQRPGGRASTAGPKTPPTPAQTAQRETDRLTRFFQLDTGQQSTVLGILTTADTQLQALTAQIQPLRTALTAAIKSNSTGMISSTLMQLSNLQEQEEVTRANAAAQIYSTVLTSTQQAQVGTGLGPLMGGGPGPGPGRFGGPRR